MGDLLISHLANLVDLKYVALVGPAGQTWFPGPVVLTKVILKLQLFLLSEHASAKI